MHITTVVVSSDLREGTDKSDNHDITKILLKVVLSTIEQTMFRFTSKSPLNIVYYNIFGYNSTS